MISNVEVQQILDILVTVVDRFQVLQMFEVFKFNLLRRDKVSTDQLLMFYSDLSFSWRDEGRADGVRREVKVKI